MKNAYQIVVIYPILSCITAGTRQRNEQQAHAGGINVPTQCITTNGDATHIEAQANSKILACESQNKL